MHIKNLFLMAIIFFAAGAVLADTDTQETVNVQKYVKGKTTLKLSGTLSEAALKALAGGSNSVSICNNLGSFLSAPTLIPESKKGYGTKAGGQKISVKAKNGKFSWTEKDVAKNFAFAVGNESIPPAKATLNSSGTIDAKDIDNFKTQEAAVLDLLAYEKSSGSVAAYTFTPELKGQNFKHAYKDTDLQVKFSANAKGKASATFKLLPNAASPAFTGESPVDTPTPIVTNRLYMVVDLSGGPDAENYPISYLNGVPEGGWTEEYKTTKLVLSKIEAGIFTMGSPTNELDRYSGEVQHEVTLTKPFFAGVFEVTQKQYELITGTNPASYQGDARPAERVSYNMIRGSEKGAGWPANSEVDETSFLGILRAKTDQPFDLPTEAQWEYACRAGTTSALNDGNNLTNSYEDGNMNKLGRYDYNANDGKGGFSEHTTVGSYMPNAWGLYDMHGNVWEWCLDWWERWNGDPVTDPKGNTEGSSRMLRGGAWYNGAGVCRSAFRNIIGPDIDSNVGYGFRVFLVP